MHFIAIRYLKLDHKTAFEVRGKLYEWNSIIIGYNKSSEIMHRTINKILLNAVGKGVEIYLDDIVSYALEIHAHDRLVLDVFKELRRNDLTINARKIQ